MSKRILSAVLALVAVAAFSITGAEARVENGSSTSSYSQKSSKSGKYVTSKTSKRYSASKSGKKRYSASKSGKKRYSGVSKGKKRYATYKKKNRLAKRSLTRYASTGGGGSSRSCLQSSARALLARIESNFGPVSIISTCRAGATIATSGKPSKHRYGLAIDFDAGRRKGAIVKWLIANHHSGGTMTYRDMSHIHVDVGGRFVSLGAYSGKG